MRIGVSCDRVEREVSRGTRRSTPNVGCTGFLVGYQLIQGSNGSTESAVGGVIRSEVGCAPSLIKDHVQGSKFDLAFENTMFNRKIGKT